MTVAPAAPRTVVHVSDSDAFGGTERALLHVLAGLDRARWRPVLYHAAAPGAAQLGAEAAALGVPSRRLPAMSHPAAGVAALLPLARALRRERAAVVHAHQTWSLSCRYGIVAAALARVPAVVASAQLFVEMPRLVGIDVQHAVLARCVDRYIAVSRHVASRLRERFGVPDAKIRVIPNAVELRAPVPADPRLRAALTGDPATPLVVTVARLDTQKGLPHLLHAAVDVPGATFAIAGEGPERGTLEALARTLGIDARVRFLGHRRDVDVLLATCDLFVLPSLYEGLPLSVLEAMAAGAPVVATAIGGTDEAVADGVTGVLVPPANAEALATAIRGLLANRARARQLATAAHAYVTRRHSAATMAGDVSRLYDELLAP